MAICLEHVEIIENEYFFKFKLVSHVALFNNNSDLLFAKELLQCTIEKKV